MYGRPKEGICKDCAALIVEGKRARAAFQASAMVPFTWTKYSHDWTRFYGDLDLTTAQHEALSDAMFDLINAIGVDAPADTCWRDEADNMRALVIPDRQDAFSRSYGNRKLILLAPGMQAKLADLHATIKAALENAYANGKTRGASLLHGLATGELTVGAFDDGLEPRKKERRG